MSSQGIVIDLAVQRHLDSLRLRGLVEEVVCEMGLNFEQADMHLHFGKKEQLWSNYGELLLLNGILR